MTDWQHAYCLKVTEFVMAHFPQFEYVFQSRRFKRNQLLYLMDDPADHLYVVRSGAVRLTVISEDGREELLDIRRENQYFGALCLCPNYRWDHQATMHEDGIIATMKAHDFMRHFFGHEELLRHFLAYFSRKLTEFSTELEEYRERDARVRIAHYLLQQGLALISPEVLGEEIKVVLSPLLPTIAEATRLAPEQVESILNEMKERSLVDWKRNSMVLHVLPLQAWLKDLLNLAEPGADQDEDLEPVGSDMTAT